ncbi:hypothetical protein PVAP13_4KG319405 [Panicum virgatum]|uniref:Uncharacterized protein n=1 Tax=Panicum virgatum TaxID=38727 RepID=A0A8T0TXM5_PANVG|nr:hypothetical protein PVAP13_4KG319405 [Panicum virgatum]
MRIIGTNTRSCWYSCSMIVDSGTTNFKDLVAEIVDKYPCGYGEVPNIPLWDAKCGESVEKKKGGQKKKVAKKKKNVGTPHNLGAPAMNTRSKVLASSSGPAMGTRSKRKLNVF